MGRPQSYITFLAFVMLCLLHTAHLRLAIFPNCCSRTQTPNAFVYFSNEKYSFHHYFYLSMYALFELYFCKICFTNNKYKCRRLRFDSSNVK